MIADVRVNGNSLRPLWCTPYSLEAGKPLRQTGLLGPVTLR